MSDGWFKNEFSYPARFKELAKDKTLVEDMANWLADCEWRDVDEKDIKEISLENPLVIVRAVQVFYQGGVDEFMRGMYVDQVHEHRSHLCPDSGE